MKNLIQKLFLFGLLTTTNCLGQSNMVPNSGFETAVDPSASCDLNGGSQNDLEDYMANTPPWNVPDKVTGCIHPVNTPDVNCKPAIAHSGARSTHQIGGEFVTAPLSTPIVSGNSYYVEFFVKGANYDSNNDQGGVAFTLGRPVQKCVEPNYIQGFTAADIRIPTDVTILEDTWTRIQKIYKSTEHATWIVLGNFNRDNGGVLRYDDITVYDLGPTCSDLYIQNTQYSAQGILIEAQSITAGYDVFPHNLPFTPPVGNVVVQNGADVTYKADHIRIDTGGFKVELGGHFRAIIAPCGRNCPIVFAEAGPDLISCGSSCITIGGSNQTSFNYSWSSSNSNALTYLTNTNTSNPNFCAPPNAFGEVNYTVTVTNVCGEVATDEVNIRYNTLAPANNMPFVSVSNISQVRFLSFDILSSGFTEKIEIDVVNAQGSTLKHYDLEANIDFSSKDNVGNFSFTFVVPDYIFSCTDVTVYVKSKNICNPITASTSFVWQQSNMTTISTGVIPNIITPNDDDINDELCYQVENAETFSLQVFDNFGVVVNSPTTGTIQSNTPCLWNGQCSSSSICADGTYFVVLSFSNSCGQTVTIPNHFITLLANSGNRMANPNAPDSKDSIPNNTVSNDDKAPLPKDQTSNIKNVVNSPDLSMQNQVLLKNQQKTFNNTATEDNMLNIFPNPNKGEFTLFYPNQMSANYTIEITDVIGREVYSTKIIEPTIQINLSSHPRGIYFVKVQSDKSMQVRKVVLE
jgi:hypothetical protein